MYQYMPVCKIMHPIIYVHVNVIYIIQIVYKAHKIFTIVII